MWGFSEVTAQEYFKSVFRTIVLVLLSSCSTALGTALPELPVSAPVNGCFGNLVAHRMGMVATGAEHAERQGPFKSVEELKSKYAHHKVNTDNRKFIQLKNAHPSPGQLSTEIEFVPIKEFNDIDKDAVTAMVNYRNELFLEVLDRYPALKAHRVADYSDFKSIRLLLEGVEPQHAAEVRGQLTRFTDEVRALFAENMQEIGADFTGSRLIRRKGIAGDPRVWNLAGSGNTPDQASQAARYARSLFREGEAIPGHVDFNDIKQALNEQIHKVEEARLKVLSDISSNTKLRSKGLLEGVSGEGVLSEDAVNVFRKTTGHSSEPDVAVRRAQIAAALRSRAPPVPPALIDYLAEAQARFKNDFHVEIAPETLLDMKVYFNRADGWCSGLYQEERVIANLDNAAGMISVDLAGLGAKNINQTMKAMVGAKDAESALVLARAAEAVVTEKIKNPKIEQLKAVFKEVFGEQSSAAFYASGDDILLIPQPIDPTYMHDPNFEVDGSLRLIAKEKMAALAARLTNPSKQRVTFLSNKFKGTAIRIPADKRVELITQAELIEKKMRATLKSLVAGKRSLRDEIEQVVTAIDFNPTQELDGKGGNMRLILGGKVKLKTAQIIQDVFEHAVIKAGYLPE